METTTQHFIQAIDNNTSNITTDNITSVSVREENTTSVFWNEETTTLTLTQLPAHVLNVHLTWKIVPIFLMVFGTIGNILSILVLRRPEIGVMPTRVYLIGLAVADLLVLYLSLGRKWLQRVSGVDIRAFDDVSCKLGIYFTYIALLSSIWIQVAISVDRFVGIVYPFRYRDVRPKHRNITLGGIIMFFAVAYGHVLYGFRHIAGTLGSACTIDTSSTYGYFHHYIYSWIDLIVAFLLPILITTVCSTVMIRNLSVSKRPVSGTASDEAKDFTRKTTKLFICLNFLFIVSTMPIRIRDIVGPYLPRIGDSPAVAYSYIGTFLLQYLNNTVNFLVYVLHGPKFQQTLKAMLCCEEPMISRSESVYRSDSVYKSSATNASQWRDSIPN